MKTFIATLAGTAFLLVGTLAAQNQSAQSDKNAGNQAASQASKEVKTNTSTTTNAGTTKTDVDKVYGKIESYEPNKSLTISMPGKTASTRTFDLTASNETRNIAPNLKVGDWVSVMEKTDNNGHKMLTIERTTQKKASRAKR